MSLRWLENPGRKRKRRRARRNGPELVVYGNPRRKRRKRKKIRARRTRRKIVAKRKRRRVTRRKKARRPRRRTRARRRRVSRRKRSRRGRRRRSKSVALTSVTIRGRRNPRRGITRWVKLPTMQELLWLGVGTLGLPTFNRWITNMLPIAALKGGWGNIGAEFVLGSVASGFARRYAGATAGDVLFLLVTARAVGRAANQINPNWGFASNNQLDYYREGQVNYMDPSLAYVSPGVKTGFAASQEENSLPTMV